MNVFGYAATRKAGQPNLPPDIKSKARSRMAKLPTQEILNWADQAGTGVARALDDYRRTQLPEALLEARTGLEALLGVVEELQARQERMG